MHHLNSTDRKIIARINTYQAPPSCGRLPILSVDSKQFLECQESIESDRRLRYKPSPNNPLDSDYDSESSPDEYSDLTDSYDIWMSSDQESSDE